MSFFDTFVDFLNQFIDSELPPTQTHSHPVLAHYFDKWLSLFRSLTCTGDPKLGQPRSYDPITPELLRFDLVFDE